MWVAPASCGVGHFESFWIFGLIRETPQLKLGPCRGPSSSTRRQCYSGCGCCTTSASDHPYDRHPRLQTGHQRRIRDALVFRRAPSLQTHPTGADTCARTSDRPRHRVDPGSPESREFRATPPRPKARTPNTAMRPWLCSFRTGSLRIFRAARPCAVPIILQCYKTASVTDNPLPNIPKHPVTSRTQYPSLTRLFQNLALGYYLGIELGN